MVIDVDVYLPLLNAILASPRRRTSADESILFRGVASRKRISGFRRVRFVCDGDGEDEGDGKYFVFDVHPDFGQITLRYQRAACFFSSLLSRQLVVAALLVVDRMKSKKRKEKEKKRMPPLLRYVCLCRFFRHFLFVLIMSPVTFFPPILFFVLSRRHSSFDKRITSSQKIFILSSI